MLMLKTLLFLRISCYNVSMSTKKSTKKSAKKSAAKNTKTVKSNKCAKPNKACGVALTIFFGVAGLVILALLVVWACIGFSE